MQSQRSNARKNKKSRRGRDRGAKRKRLRPANVDHQTAVESTAHLAPVVEAVLGASVKSSRRRNLLRTATMTIVPPERRGAHGVDPPPDVALQRDAALPPDVDLQGGGHLHVAMDRITGVVAAAVLHPATMTVIVVTIIGIVEVLMIAVMTEIVVVLATAVVVMTVAVVEASEIAVVMTVAVEEASETAEVMIVAVVEALETVVVIAEEEDLTIDAEKEEMTDAAVDLETAGIVGEVVADTVGGMIIDVMNVVLAEVILKEAGVNLLLGKKAVLFT